jgi:hypothetical protein
MKRAWPNLPVKTGENQEKVFNDDSRCSGRDSNQADSEYK